MKFELQLTVSSQIGNGRIEKDSFGKSTIAYRAKFVGTWSTVTLPRIGEEIKVPGWAADSSYGSFARAIVTDVKHVPYLKDGVTIIVQLVIAERVFQHSYEDISEDGRSVGNSSVEMLHGVLARFEERERAHLAAHIQPHLEKLHLHLV